jgi:MFS family permease
MTSTRRNWTLAIVSVALFMVVLDNLVVSVALPSIRRDFGASIQSLEWTVNAYVLAYAVLLLTGAALGDRFGRKRMFLARGIALGVWSGISGTAVAIGPLVGGAVVQGISWHWIFWLNVPIGLVLLPVALRRLAESRGPYGTLDLPGLVLAGAGAGAFGIVFGLVRSQSLGWTSPTILASLIGGALLLAAFVAWELRATEPMLPMSFFAKRSFAVTNVVSLSMYFGMFGSIFFLSQYMQNVLGNTPLQAGLKLLVWTGASMLVAPLAGVFSERYGSRPFMVAGLTLQAISLGWLATITATSLPYTQMVIPFIMAGAGMSLVFAPSANAVLSAVRVDQAGQASGANNAIREVGGVLGVAVLASVFTGSGGYSSPQAFVNGLIPAMWVGTAILAAGALVALLLPFRTPRAAEGERAVAEPPLAVLAGDTA